MPKLARQKAGECGRGNHPDGDAGRNQAQASAYHKLEYIACVRTQCHTDSNFMRPLGDGVSHDATDSGADE